MIWFKAVARINTNSRTDMFPLSSRYPTSRRGLLMRDLRIYQSCVDLHAPSGMDVWTYEERTMSRRSWRVNREISKLSGFSYHHSLQSLGTMNHRKLCSKYRSSQTLGKLKHDVFSLCTVSGQFNWFKVTIYLTSQNAQEEIRTVQYVRKVFY